MTRKNDLLNGPIFSTLTKLALPIMATSLIQMAYNMIDMIWIGKVGAGAVAAVGAAGMFMWLSNGLAVLAKMGGQVKVAHAIGAQNQKEAIAYAQNAFQLVIIFGLLFGGISLVFSNQMIGFFQLNSQQVINEANTYLKITCGLAIFPFVSQVFTGILTSMGNSKISFQANCIGLVINIILDPLMIFGFGPIPQLGVAGAAIATILSQIVVFIIFILSTKDESTIFSQLHLLEIPESHHVKDILKIGTPIAVQSMLFSSISMIIARLIAGWGDDAVAVQKIGSQIESISWMTAEGFSAAVNSFIAQNVGAKKMDRVKQGYSVAFRVMVVWGAFTTFLLLVFPEPIFKIFLNDEHVLQMGVDYLRILGISELLMCIEITTNGAFAGLGKPIIPSINSTILTAARIPLAILLSSTILGLNGVWWSITISSILKGIFIFILFIYTLRKMMRTSAN